MKPAASEGIDWKRTIFATGKWLVMALVLAGVGYAIWKAMGELKKFSLSDINWFWFTVSAVLYLLGMGPAWLFWHRTLQAMGQAPTLWESFRAFYVSQMGKYVPGKAMVVIIRAGMVRSARVDSMIAVVTVFVETLTMMATGALVSAIIVVVMFRDQTGLVLLALGLMLCSGLPTFPPLFRQVVKRLTPKRAKQKLEESLSGISYRLMAEGWIIDGFGWIILGLSLGAALMALPGMENALYHPSLLPLVIAAMALACVAGFVSMLPGGAGVREGVIIALLSPVVLTTMDPAVLERFDIENTTTEVAAAATPAEVSSKADPEGGSASTKPVEEKKRQVALAYAIGAAVLLRLSSLLAELLFSCILYFCRRRGETNVIDTHLLDDDPAEDQTASSGPAASGTLATSNE